MKTRHNGSTQNFKKAPSLKTHEFPKNKELEEAWKLSLLPRLSLKLTPHRSAAEQRRRSQLHDLPKELQTATTTPFYTHLSHFPPPQQQGGDPTPSVAESTAQTKNFRVPKKHKPAITAEFPSPNT